MQKKMAFLIYRIINESAYKRMLFLCSSPSLQVMQLAFGSSEGRVGDVSPRPPRTNLLSTMNFSYELAHPLIITFTKFSSLRGPSCTCRQCRGRPAAAFSAL